MVHGTSRPAASTPADPRTRLLEDALVEQTAAFGAVETEDLTEDHLVVLTERRACLLYTSRCV